MYEFKITGTLAFLRYLLLFQLLIFPIGCSTAPKPVGPHDVSVALPSYELGTTYVYSDGSWETVADISPQLVTWHDHRGNVYNRFPDFTYRSAKWKTRTRHGTRQFVPRSDVLFKKKTSLWPLKEGNVSGFSEMVTSNNPGEPPKSYRVNWTCEVIGTDRVAVMAGQFDTWEIACKRYDNSKNPSKARVKETRIWNYAPEIEHFVITERRYSGRKAARRLELLAVLPPLSRLPDVTRQQMDSAFQMALELKKSGETAAWSIPDTSWSGQITPTDTFRLADGRYSRRYIQKLNHPDGQRIYHGLAVRDSKGVWVIPRR
ncbi:MAG: hypothetical protein V2J65_28570 [Desulfobacteraceae bacterium]|jgi:hypothetical protein|nr:hypothetical protein [Desulfobacteraceae bacterium]